MTANAGQVNEQKLLTELAIAGIPVDGFSNVDGTKANFVIWYNAAATQNQITQGNTILANHNPNTLINLVDCKVVGAVGVAFIRGSVSSKLLAGYLVSVGALSAVTTFPTVSIGTNSPNYDNVMPATLLSNFTVALDSLLTWIATPGLAITTDVVLFCNVRIAAIGTTCKIVVAAVVIDQTRLSGNGVISL